MNRFKNRSDAGRQLAERLSVYKERDDVVVLALPRGGVPVGLEIATALGAPLDVYLVRKLGTPGREELAMGAIASDGARTINESIVQTLGISESVISRVADRERSELQRREEIYRGDSGHIPLKDKTVILVDDGLATGASMKAAVKAVRTSDPAKVVVAVGTAPEETVRDLRARDDVDEVVVVLTPSLFRGVGGSYEDFSQTTDEEVRACLQNAPQCP